MYAAAAKNFLYLMVCATTNSTQQSVRILVNELDKQPCVKMNKKLAVAT